MAILTSYKRPTRRLIPAPVVAPVKPPAYVPVARVAEAPDRGYANREAPEARPARRAEAPDAGERRTYEEGYTHGRSYR